jgi:hypothetical protein
MSGRSKLFARLAAAALFAAALVGGFVAVVLSFVRQPRESVILIDTAPPTGYIGGVVQNEIGLPIPNVILTLNWPKDPTGMRRARQNGKTRTDADGRWTFGGVPQGSLANMRISLAQPGYVTAGMPVPPPDQLLARTDILVMRRGMDISGQVVDATGHAIAGAAISTRQRYWVKEGLSAQTDVNGHFMLHHVAVDPAPTLTTQAPGFAPDARHIPTTLPDAVVQIVLAPGRTVRGTVKDQLGHPLPEVTLSLNAWRDFRSVKLAAGTDALGQFTLNDVPLDGFWVWAHKKRYIAQQPWLPADKNQLDLVLWLPISVHGKVIDAQTHLPLEKFAVLAGGKNPTKPDLTFNSPATTFSGGQYQLSLKEPPDESEAWYVRITADGYRPVTSPPLKDSGPLDFALEKASG